LSLKDKNVLVHMTCTFFAYLSIASRSRLSRDSYTSVEHLRRSASYELHDQDDDSEHQKDVDETADLRTRKAEP
jgi:hypothetical protein